MNNKSVFALTKTVLREQMSNENHPSPMQRTVWKDMLPSIDAIIV